MTRLSPTHSIRERASMRAETLGKYGSGSSAATRTGGGYGAAGIGENDVHHIKERKHEAYASVRLCNKDGDVLWSPHRKVLGPNSAARVPMSRPKSRISLRSIMIVHAILCPLPSPDCLD